jgi:hypothetical protein
MAAAWLPAHDHQAPLLLPGLPVPLLLLLLPLLLLASS